MFPLDVQPDFWESRSCNRDEIPSFALDSTAPASGAFLFLGSEFPCRTVETRRESIRARRKCASKFSGVQGLARWSLRICGAVPVVTLPENRAERAPFDLTEAPGGNIKMIRWGDNANNRPHRPDTNTNLL